MSGEDIKPPRRRFPSLSPDPSDHTHKFYLFKTQNSFEPYPGLAEVDTPQLYQMVEYAIMFCNCGEVIKMKVKNGKD